MIYGHYEKALRYLLWIPIILLVFSVSLLAYNQAATGSFLQRDIELTGGKMVIAELESDTDAATINGVLPEARVHITRGISRNLIVEIPFENNETVAVEKIKSVADIGAVSVRTVGPALGNIFFQQTITALVAAFIAMSIIVFIIFRTFVPGATVVLAAATDIIGTMGIMSVLGIPLSLPVLAALLMLIGYSVDTDILLTSNLLKRGGNIEENVKRAIKTGLTMTCTTLVALTALYFATGSFVLEQIALVLIIGLLIDMPATWFTNTGLLLRWVKKHAAA